MKWQLFFLSALSLLFFSTVYGQVNTDSVKICAIRVAFVEDDNELTTGNGSFMIDTVTTDPNAIDPTPHDKVYFQDQIRAAANYFENVSGGRLIVSGTVFPPQNEAAYQLPQTMGYYNPNTTDAAINKGIGELFIDALEAADQSGDAIVFDDYDLVVVFHAGVGKDIDVGYDPTPQDIPSLFITADFLKKSFGDDYEGVPVNQGSSRVNSGILLPETENQDGNKIALTGIFVSNIGSYLGLYDLFSPSKQRSAIGRFGLMDVGLLNANGLLPSPPGAFSRKLLGWEEPLLLDKPQTGVEIARLGAENPQGKPKMVQVPINNDEYFLLEYRGDSAVDIDSLFAVLYEDRDEVPGYLEVLKTYFPDQIEVAESGVLLSVADYDWGLPGAGIVIWHVDEKVIAEKASENKINDDPDRRAVDIEEADGSEDIGRIYSLLEAGYQKELGWFADFWYSNRIDELEDFELYENEFSDDTRPNTRANQDNAVSHITIKNFSDNQSDIMSFDFERDFYENNFPLKLTTAENLPQDIAGAAVQGQSAGFIFYCSGQGKISAVGDGGRGLFTEDKTDFASITASADFISLALADAGNDGLNDYLFAASADSLYGFHLTQSTADKMAAPLFAPVGLSSELMLPLVINDDKVFAGLTNDSLVVFDFNGQRVTEKKLDPNTRDFVVLNGSEVENQSESVLYAALAPSAGGGNDLVEFSSAENQFVVNGLAEDNVRFDAQPTGQFALADLDNNGTYDIVFNQPDAVYAYNLQGFPLSNFPVKPELEDGDEFIGSPLVADLDGDGSYDLVALTSAGQVLALDQSGQFLPGFPVSTGGTLKTAPLILQLDTDPKLELAAVTSDGSLYAWQLAVDGGDPLLHWTSANLNPDNNAVITALLDQKTVGGSLMPKNKAYNYPNPNSGSETKIRYYLNEPARVSIRIFDSAGTTVDQFSGPGNGAADNEIAWDVSDIASGVYLCQIEAKSSSHSETRIIKIMVVH